MNGWMKKTFTAEGVTEWPPGPCIEELVKHFGQSGAVMLLLDVSSSMLAKLSDGSSRIEQAKIGCRGFIDEAAAGGYGIGLMLWSHAVEDVAIPSEDGATARLLLSQARPRGGTDVVPALAHAGKILMQADVDDRVIAIFGDGDLGAVAEAKQEAARWASKGIRIITLGLGDKSAKALGVISTESDDLAPRAATDTTLVQDIRSMASGLMTPRRKR